MSERFCVVSGDAQSKASVLRLSLVQAPEHQNPQARLHFKLLSSIFEFSVALVVGGFEIIGVERKPFCRLRHQRCKSFFEFSGIFKLSCFFCRNVENGRLVTDPDEPHNPHVCTPRPFLDVVAKRVWLRVLSKSHFDFGYVKILLVVGNFFVYF